MRKTVTVLFCDVVGSTALGAATDPETTRRVMSRYAAAMAEIVEQHGGTVERFRGDEVMAVFGVPTAHEDDALRAVRAATEMQRRLDVMSSELREAWGVSLACRIGINTGEVVAGDPGTGETFVTGDAVNLAKRLEQAAEPGTILIGTTTYPLVRDAVKVGPRERFTAKGKSEAVGRFRLDEVDATASGYARRLDAPLVGRADELATLRNLVQDAFRERRCRVVLVLGAAGIGKSRLVRELTSELDGIANVATGRCLPYGSGITFWPLQQLVADVGGLEAVTALFADADDAEVVVERLRAATGGAETGAPSTEVFWAARRLLERMSEHRPTLVVFEDLHWAEPTMLDLVEYLAAFATGPLVVLGIARPELVEERPSLGAARLELEQLADEQISALVEKLGIEDDALRMRITTTSEGNPLFAEQLAAMIADAGPTDAIELPGSIHALLAARIDSLEPPERRTLERASIIGREFWPRALVDLSSHGDQPRVTSHLMSLVRKGLVEPSRSEVPGEDAYRFRHSLICDETYAGIPKAVRAELHERFARWLQAQAREDRGFGEHDEILGYHLEQAYRCRTALGPDDAPARALAVEAGTLLAAAGRRALGREDVPAAMGLFERALHCCRRTTPTATAFLTELGSAAIRAGSGIARGRFSRTAISSARRRRRPQGRAPRDDRAPVAALLHGAGRSRRGGSAGRGGRHPRAGGDRRSPRAREGVVAPRASPTGLRAAGGTVPRRSRGRSSMRAVPLTRVSSASSSSSTPRPCTTARRRCPRRFAPAPTCSPTLPETDVRGRTRDDGSLGFGRWRDGSTRLASSTPTPSPSTRSSACASGERFARSSVHRSRASRGTLPPRRASCALGYTMLEEMGERGARSALAGFLADLLAQQGNDVEAEGFVAVATRDRRRERCRAPGALEARPGPHDLAGAATRARPKAGARGRALAAETDFLDLRAGTLTALGEVLQRGRKERGSDRRRLDEARALYRRKGNLAAFETRRGGERVDLLTFNSGLQGRTITSPEEVRHGEAQAGEVHRTRLARRSPATSCLLEDALEGRLSRRAMATKPDDERMPSGEPRTFQFKVVGIRVEGMNPITDYIVDLDDV